MIESYNAWIVFKCCESIKETKLTVELLNCWTPTSPEMIFIFEKLQKLRRTAFDLQSDEGYVSKGQLLWMLADSGMPVNKATGEDDRWDVKKKVGSGGAFASQMARIHLHLFVSIGFVGNPIGQNLNKFSNSEAWQKHRFCKM